MAIMATDSGGSKYPLVGEGVYNAICYSIVDLGIQYNEAFAKHSRQILVTFELPDETIEIEGEQKPRAISKTYTLSLADKATLRKDLIAWRGRAFTDEELKGFELKNVLGKGCQLQLVHSTKGGNTYANIASIMGLPKGTKLNPPVNNLVYYDLEADDALQKLNDLPNWVQDKIKKSETYDDLINTDTFQNPAPTDDDSEDLPF